MSHTHPADTNYPIIRTTSNVDATPIQTILDLYDVKTSGPKFRMQKNKSQDGVAIVIDCQCELTWAEFIVVEPRLDEFRFIAGDIPSYLSLGCEDTSHASARTIIQETGVSGVEWSAPEEI